MAANWDLSPAQGFSGFGLQAASYAAQIAILAISGVAGAGGLSATAAGVSLIALSSFYLITQLASNRCFKPVIQDRRVDTFITLLKAGTFITLGALGMASVLQVSQVGVWALRAFGLSIAAETLGICVVGGQTFAVWSARFACRCACCCVDDFSRYSTNY